MRDAIHKEDIKRKRGGKLDRCLGVLYLFAAKCVSCVVRASVILPLKGAAVSSVVISFSDIAGAVLRSLA